MTLADQLNQSIDRIQDICCVDFRDDGSGQRTELWFVLCDLIAAVTNSPVLHVRSLVPPEQRYPKREAKIRPLDKADLDGEIFAVCRRSGMRFVLLPDDFTVDA